MKRREFSAIVGGAAAWPLAARTQQSGTPRRIGLLPVLSGGDARGKEHLAGLRDGLARLGWIEGSTIHIDYRYAGGHLDQFSVLAKELIALHPEVIFAQSTPVAAALQRETRTIPIVFVEVSDPIGSGFIASLAHPGGNLTGIIQYETGIAGKWLAMLKEIAPNLARAALLANPKGTAYEYFLRNAPRHHLLASKSSPVLSTTSPTLSDRSARLRYRTTVVFSVRPKLSSLLIAISSLHSPPNIGCLQFILGAFLLRTAASCHTALISSMCTNNQHRTSTRSCVVPTQSIYQCSRPRSTKLPSISKLRKPLGFQCLHRFSCAPTR
jgi:ABC transporter substrate binding protein